MDDLGALAWKSVGLNNPPSTSNKSKPLNTLSSSSSTNAKSNSSPLSMNSRNPSQRQTNGMNMTMGSNSQTTNNLASASIKVTSLPVAGMGSTLNGSPMNHSNNQNFNQFITNSGSSYITKNDNNRNSNMYSQNLSFISPSKPNYQPLIPSSTSGDSPQMKNKQNLVSDPFASLVQLDSSPKPTLNSYSPQRNVSPMPIQSNILKPSSISNNNNNNYSSSMNKTTTSIAINSVPIKNGYMSLNSMMMANSNTKPQTTAIDTSQQQWNLEFFESKQYISFDTNNINTIPSMLNFGSIASNNSSHQQADIFDAEFLELNMNTTSITNTPGKHQSQQCKVNENVHDDLFAEFNKESNKPTIAAASNEMQNNINTFVGTPEFERNQIHHHQDDSFQEKTITRQDTVQDKDLAKFLSSGYTLEAASTALSLNGSNYESALMMLKENRDIQMDLNQKHERENYHHARPSTTSSTSLGLSFVSSAKQALASSKKKLTEVVGKAQEQLAKQGNPTLSSFFGGTGTASSENYIKRGEERNNMYNNSSFSSSDEEISSTTDMYGSSSAIKKNHSRPSTPKFVMAPSPSMKTVTNLISNQTDILSTSSPLTMNQGNPTHVSMPKIKEPRKKVEAPATQVSMASDLKEQGNNVFKAGQYAEAVEFYSKAIDCLPVGHDLLVTFYNNRASAGLKTGEFKKVVQDTTLVIEWIIKNDVVEDSKQDYIKAYLRRALANENMEKWSASKADYEILVSLESSKPVYDGLARCQKALNMMTFKNSQMTVSRMESLSLDMNTSTSSSNKVTGQSQYVSSKNQDSATANIKDDNLTFDPFHAESSSTSIASSFGGNGPIKTNTNNLATGMMQAFVVQEPENKETIVVTEAIQNLRLLEKEAERMEDEKVALQDQVDAKINAWNYGKESNLRALIATLDQLLWSELGWKSCSLGDLIQPNQVKIRYMRAVAKLHPDKLSSSTTLEQQMIASSVFTILTKAWDEFKVQNGL